MSAGRRSSTMWPAGSARIGLALACAAATTAGAAPHGRVIRVERTPAVTAPGYCLMPDGGAPICYGRPRPGERVTVFDLTRSVILGDFAIESVGPPGALAEHGLCTEPAAFTVRGRLPRGGDDPDASLVGLRNLALGGRARLLPDEAPPSGRSEEEVALAVDADGDDRADVVVTRYSCDAAGAPDPDGLGRCFDVHVADHGELRRASHAIIKTCR